MTAISSPFRYSFGAAILCFMKIVLPLSIALIFSQLLFEPLSFADCRGCCSHHGGVTCTDGQTMCKDGTALSQTCRSKGCNKCGMPLPESAPSQQSAPSEYDRKDWPHWIDADNDCQDTRAEVLIRDNTGTIKFKRNKPCNVSWGEWRCPYTGKKLTKASDVDIDHIVPLSHAFQTGGASWTREKRREFANDPDNLLTVEDNINQEKGDKAPDEWRPPHRDFWGEYARKWRVVKKKYGLTISASEEKALIEMERAVSSEAKQ